MCRLLEGHSHWMNPNTCGDIWEWPIRDLRVFGSACVWVPHCLVINAIWAPGFEGPFLFVKPKATILLATRRLPLVVL